MSYERGLAAINLEMPDKVPHTEYLSNRQYILKRTGLDIDKGEEAGRAGVEMAKLLDYDFIWSTFGFDFGTPSAWMGRARYSETEELRPASYDIKTVEEVLSFDAMKQAKHIPSMDELTKAVRQSYEGGCAAYPNAVFTGGFYQTVFTWHILTFGWTCSWRRPSPTWSASTR